MGSLPVLPSPESRTAASCSTSAWADPLHPGLEGPGLLLEVCRQPVEGLHALPGRLPEHKPSKSHNTQHTNFLEYNHRGLTVNAGYMEYCHDEYADQLCLYGWLLGEKPGDENVVGMIKEIVSKPAEPCSLAAGRQSPRPGQG